MSDKLKAFYERVPVWKQLYFKWKALPNVPFRKKFFVGYDLEANTYWEFYIDGKKPNIRPRRLMEPYKPEPLLLNYFDRIPIQWVQWLKFSRKNPPSIFDILQDEERVRKLQIMSQFRDGEQLYNKDIQQQRIESNLAKELNRVNSESAQNAANILNKTGHNIEDSITHQEIKSKNDTKLQTDAQLKAENEENDPWAASRTSDQPEEATIKPRR